MKKVSKLMAMALALFMVLSLATPAKADDLDPDYTALEGTSTTFDKYLVVDENASIPDITFTYTIVGQAKDSNPADEQNVVAGPDGAIVGTAVFTSDPNTTPSYTSQTGDDNFTLDANKRYAKKTVTINFSGVEFTEPGIYRYKLTEQEVAGRTDVSYDTQATTPGSKIRYVDVYVVDNDGELEISGYVIHEDDTTVTITDGVVSDPNATPIEWTYDGQAYNDEDEAKAEAEADIDSTTTPGKYIFGGTEYDTEELAIAAAHAAVVVTAAVLSDKNDCFVNEIETHDLHFGKEVTGNQGSKDKYFQFTLNLSEIPEGTTILFNLSEAETAPDKTDATAYTTMNNIGGLTGPDDNSYYSYTFTAEDAAAGKDFVFYLKHNQYIDVLGLPKTAAYELSEDAEDYKSTVGTSKEAKAAVSASSYYRDATAEEIADPTTAGVTLVTADGTDIYKYENGDTVPDGTQVVKVEVPAQAAELYDDVVSGTMSDDVYTGFTNTRGGVIPTGVILAAVPGTILAGGALVYLFGKKRHEDEE